MFRTSGGAAGPRLSRRTVLRAALLAPAASVLPAATAGAAEPLRIRPREEWAQGLPVRGELLPEQDVRFLLVHHSASPNDYSTGDVVGELQRFYRLHTGPERGWADLAYNVLVDRFGGVWEGRAGSARGPVEGSATGGSQGFAQLACFIGNHTSRPPTAAARASMLRVLAWLADRSGLDTAPGATTTFVSRGSNRWAAGSSVTTPTISAHRDMSRTTCPGDGVYRDVRTRFPAEVTALRAAVALRPSAVAASPVPSPAPSSFPVPSAVPATAPAAVTTERAPDDEGLPVVLLGSGAVLAAAAGAAAVRHHLKSSGEERRP